MSIVSCPGGGIMNLDQFMLEKEDNANREEVDQEELDEQKTDEAYDLFIGGLE